MIVALKTSTPAAKVLVETLPGWYTTGKAIPKRLVTNGDAQGGRFQTDLDIGKYLVTITELIPQKPVGHEDYEGVDPRWQMRAGNSEQFEIEVLESGQYVSKPFVPAPHPHAEKVARDLDILTALGKREAARG